MMAPVTKPCACCGRPFTRPYKRRNRVFCSTACRGRARRLPATRERILSWVVIDQSSGCWIWQGEVKPDGYSEISVDGRKRSAHRVAYELFVGPIPDGLTVDHTCHNADPECPGGACIHRRCVNPEHFEAVTSGENVLRGKGPCAVNARLTHCKRGHKLGGANAYPSGGRRCRVCTDARVNARRQAARVAA